METNTNVDGLIRQFYNDPQVMKLQNYYHSLSFMEILGVARNEHAHSSFLAWLFDSHVNYGLGTMPLKLLLELLVKVKENKPFPSSIRKEDIFIRSLNVSQPSHSIREYLLEHESLRGNIDIYIPFEIDNRQYALVIENKVKASENKEQSDGAQTIMQTDKYFELFDSLSNINPHIEYIYVFLSPEHKGERVIACNQNFINISYSMIVESVISPLLANNEIHERARFFLNDYLKILHKPNISKDSEMILAISESERALLSEIAYTHKELGELLCNDKELNEEENGLLNNFREFNWAVILSIWPTLQKKNSKNRTFFDLGIERGSILYLAKSQESNEPDSRNIMVRTLDEENLVEYILDGKKNTGIISFVARELSGKPYGLNGFQWFIYHGQNLSKIRRIDEV